MIEKNTEELEKKPLGTAGNYGPLNFIDYLMPDGDPNLQAMEQETPERTLQRYSHNRKKVYGWTQVAVFFGAIATLLAGLCLTAYDAALFPEIIKATLDSNYSFEQIYEHVPVAGSANTGITSVMVVGGSAILSGVCSLVAGFAGYMGFRTDIKNDVDQESLLAKQIGRHLAHTLDDIAKEKLVNGRVTEGKAVEELKTAKDIPPSHTTPSYTTGAPLDPGTIHPAATDNEKPESHISQAEAISRLIHPGMQRVH